MIYLQQNCRRLNGDLETPISLFLNLAGAKEGVLLESAEVDGRWGRYSLAATDFLVTASCRAGLLNLKIDSEQFAVLEKFEGQPFLEGLRSLISALHITGESGQPDLPPITRSLYGYLGYDAAGLMENKLARSIKVDRAEGVFVLPGNVYLFDHDFNNLFHLSLETERTALMAKPKVISEKNRPALLGQIETSLGKAEYQNAVGDIKELIRLGEAIQVVLATQFSADFNGDLFGVYRQLRRINPSPYMFYLKLSEMSMAVSSPEVMVGCDKNRLRLCPIAGTRPRGSNIEEDRLMAEELAADPKERSEHVMLVDLGRNDLGKVAVPGTVKLDRFMKVERFSHVMHLTSYLSADLEAGFDAIDILRAAFPAGTLSGAPKIRSMEIISDFEPTPRQVYGGVLGWMGLDKDAVNMDFGITIRGAWARNGRIYWEAGAGIVHDSDPQTEWQECLNKAAVVKKAIEAYLIKNSEEN